MDGLLGNVALLDDENAEQADLCSAEVLYAATAANADTFGLWGGRLVPGQHATMLLVSGRPDRALTDSRSIGISYLCPSRPTHDQRAEMLL